MGERRAPYSRLLPRLLRLRRELAKFGTVGALGFLVNVAVFNLCINVLDLAPVRSGVAATAVAIATNYLGNRYWTYRHRDKRRMHREAGLFLLFSGIGMVIENGALAISHYGLDFTSPLADNIAKNVVGLGLATVFRFWSYRTWVFRDGAGGTGGSVSGRFLGLPAEEEGEDRRMLLK
ncbi:GtrA family protein [Streptomyces sp. TRM 70361]|uniref:GtrA family protein n=1 Tax=Streptomyces sp. TRM 70361 TaxID=3116553 RepID=UPI002E7BAC24|nr:GtrA family protein [Streptomyces sp. TRM 70361]MEE1938571.1 GtrA family protein [Streptomyces sp. TRM 70361]